MIINDIKHSSNSFILDGDIVSETDFLLIDDENIIHRNGEKIDIELKIDWPIVRIISDDFFLLVNGESSDQKDNAWIIDNNGAIESSFYIGNATNIIITKSHIVASYSKCSLNTNRIFTTTYRNPDYATYFEELPSKKAINTEGLAVFDFKGSCLFKYMSDAKDKDFIPFMEIYSFLKKDENTIYLLPYLFDNGFAILELSLKNYSLKNVLNLEEIIIENYLPRAMARKNGNWYFLMTNSEEIENGNFHDLKSHLFKMKDTQSLEKLGECCFSLKMHGNHNGSFSVPLGIKDKNQNSCYMKI